MKNVLSKIVDWFKEYDDEITWFLIGSLNADGLAALARKETGYGLLMLFMSTAMWYFYMKDLKDRK